MCDKGRIHGERVPGLPAQILSMIKEPHPALVYKNEISSSLRFVSTLIQTAMIKCDRGHCGHSMKDDLEALTKVMSVY